MVAGLRRRVLMLVKLAPKNKGRRFNLLAVRSKVEWDDRDITCSTARVTCEVFLTSHSKSCICSFIPRGEQAQYLCVNYSIVYMNEVSHQVDGLIIKIAFVVMHQQNLENVKDRDHAGPSRSIHLQFGVRPDHLVKNGGGHRLRGP
jgi:hypothetical protein